MKSLIPMSNRTVTMWMKTPQGPWKKWKDEEHWYVLDVLEFPPQPGETIPFFHNGKIIFRRAWFEKGIDPNTKGVNK